MHGLLPPSFVASVCFLVDGDSMSERVCADERQIKVSFPSVTMADRRASSSASLVGRALAMSGVSLACSLPLGHWKTGHTTSFSACVLPVLEAVPFFNLPSLLSATRRFFPLLFFLLASFSRPPLTSPGRLVRLIPEDPSSSETTAIKTLFNYRLSPDPSLARIEWLDIVEARHQLWTSISSEKRE